MSEIIQGSEEWLALRRTKVTSTDMAKIMGISPWGTAHDVYLEKMDMAPPFKPSPSMAYGKRMEGPLRKEYEEKIGEWFPPEVIFHKDGWAMSSLDGVNASRTRALEVKTCSAAVFEAAQGGEIPDYYMTQVQHSMACEPKLRDVMIIFYNKDRKAEVLVERDEELIAKMEAIGKDFYDNCVVGKNPPPLTEKDSVDMTKDDVWMSQAAEAKLLYPQYQDMKKRWSNLRQGLIDCTDDGNCAGGGAKITRSWTKGGLDTDKMIKDGIDIDKYRKSPTCRILLTIDLKEDECLLHA